MLRGLLLTGGAPLYLRAELTGDAGADGAEAARRGVWTRAVVAARARSPAATWRPTSARRAPSTSASEPLRDRAAAAGASPAADRDEAYRLAILLAEQDAEVGDYRQALHALDAAAALAGGVLPDEWVESRARWQRELAPQG